MAGSALGRAYLRSSGRGSARKAQQPVPGGAETPLGGTTGQAGGRIPSPPPEARQAGWSRLLPLAKLRINQQLRKDCGQIAPPPLLLRPTGRPPPSAGFYGNWVMLSASCLLGCERHRRPPRAALRLASPPTRCMDGCARTHQSPLKAHWALAQAERSRARVAEERSKPEPAFPPARPQRLHTRGRA